jgi:hypothetical protein
MKLVFNTLMYIFLSAVISMFVVSIASTSFGDICRDDLIHLYFNSPGLAVKLLIEPINIKCKDRKELT